MKVDSFLHKGLRNKLVEGLRIKGIHDEAVLKAMNKVPRHLFMDSSFVHFAYQDKAFPISENQTISMIFVVYNWCVFHCGWGTFESQNPWM